MDFDLLLQQLSSSPEHAGRMVHVEELPYREPAYGTLAHALHPVEQLRAAEQRHEGTLEDRRVAGGRVISDRLSLLGGHVRVRYRWHTIGRIHAGVLLIPPGHPRGASIV